MGKAARANKARRMRAGHEIRLVNPSTPAFAQYVAENAALTREVVQAGSAHGQRLVLCGAGPSLVDHARDWCNNADQVWGCNSALTWLASNGHRITHGFAVEQSERMCAVWRDALPVEYLIASTVSPQLTTHLITHGRDVRFFHNLVELANQDAFYRAHFPVTVMAGAGLNAVTRALDVAEYMGFAEIVVLGADCCVKTRPDAPSRIGLVPGTPEYDAWIRDWAIMHSDGSSPVESGCSPVTLAGIIDGREWVMQPDMAITASWLVRMAKASVGNIRLVGDTFPNAIIGKPESFLARLPYTANARGAAIPIAI